MSDLSNLILMLNRAHAEHKHWFVRDSIPTGAAEGEGQDGVCLVIQHPNNPDGNYVQFLFTEDGQCAEVRCWDENGE
jgi:hypothetical protein